MRMGELLGLQWSEVDLRVGVIHVAWAVTDGGAGVGILRKPTKRSDWRDVPLTGAAEAAFQRQHERCATRFELTIAPRHYVFPGRAGRISLTGPIRSEIASPQLEASTR